MLSRSVTRGPKEEFGVALSAFDRGFDNSHDAPAERRDKFRDVIAHCSMDSPLANDTLSDGGSAGLKLRLDQRDEFGGRFSECECRRQHVFKRNKADVDRDEIGRFIKPSRG